jgi:hypothetical protein
MPIDYHQLKNSEDSSKGKMLVIFTVAFFGVIPLKDLFDLLFDFIPFTRNRTGSFQSGIYTQLWQDYSEKDQPTCYDQYHYG